MKILTLIVTYNEADNISRLIPEILNRLPDSSILVVDDNSPDGTTEVVRAIGARFPKVDVICRTHQRGYGSATVVGLRHAIQHGYDCVLTLDADFSHDPADLPRIAAALTDADVAIGSRYAGGVRVLNWEVRRLLLSLVANAYLRFLSGLACFDCTSGFRGYRISILGPALLEKIRATGYAFLPELLFSLERPRITEVPICYTERRLGESKMSNRVIAEAILSPWMLCGRRVARFVRRSVFRNKRAYVFGSPAARP